MCYVCAGERMRGALSASAEHSVIALGAQPTWDPRDWPEFLERHASVRRQLRRSRNKAVEVESADPVRDAADPELRAVFEEWLEGRPLPPLRFLAAPDILRAGARDRVLLVARRHGRAVAFLAASPIAARNGYLIELLARSRAAPNGTSELLIDSAMRRFAAERRGYLTLGLVALARAADREMRGNPLWLRAIMRFARAHANRFYHFRGLEHFRTKLAPRGWEAGLRDLQREALLGAHAVLDGGGFFGHAALAGHRNRRGESRCGARNAGHRQLRVSRPDRRSGLH